VELLWGTYHVPQNVFLVIIVMITVPCVHTGWMSQFHPSAAATSRPSISVRNKCLLAAVFLATGLLCHSDQTRTLQLSQTICHTGSLTTCITQCPNLLRTFAPWQRQFCFSFSVHCFWRCIRYCLWSYDRRWFVFEAALE